ncbi:MAG: tetratricopeptide repeat protein, partial [Gemmatimonadetes bacterium]|nr:tetratricopeptide repeat protein [Gemmatimonadota bacterium]
MSRRYLYGLTAFVLLALIVPLILLSRTGDGDSISDPVEGDIAADLSTMAPADMPTQAEAFLATDRPWRAARVMRRYLEAVPDAPADHKVLAARAEAGWGGWPEVHALLEGVPALDTHEGGIGLYLLARARDEQGDAQGAVASYRAFLALSAPAGELEQERAAARLRQGLALIRAGNRAAGESEVRMTAGQIGGASIWLDLLRADALAQTGDTAAVRAAVGSFDSGITGLRAWRARIEAARVAGDPAGARALANQARAWAGTAGTRAEFFVAAGLVAIEMGDVSAGRGAMRAAIDETAAGPHAQIAAEQLRAGQMTPADHLAVARVYSAQGLHAEAVDGYRRFLAAGSGTVAAQAEVHMQHANALFYSEEYGEVGAALRPIASERSARMLRARAEAHRGNVDEAAAMYLAVGGVQGVFLAASVRHDANQIRQARQLYQRVVSQHPGSSQMGLSMMRLAGMDFLEGEYASAARIWDQYRSRYPRGTLALQSTYWAGRAREATGDSAGAAALYRSVRERARDSY